MKKIFNILFLLLTINLYGQQIVELCPEYQSTFTYSSTTGINGTYTWYVDNSVYIGSEVTLEWDQEGTHILNLYFISNGGCEDTISYVVNVIPCSDVFLYVPNSFTPNYDGLNDSFQVKGINFKNFNMLIYNRWGEMIYETNDPLFGWDGTYKGNECQQDIYVYMIRYYDLKNRVYYKTGHINLIK